MRLPSVRTLGIRSLAAAAAATFLFALTPACGSDGSGKAAPPTQSSTVEVPFQITTVYALEQKGDTDPTARARYYDAAQVLDIWGNAGTLALSPGDAAYADGKQLDVETRTETLGTLRVDYSQTIPKGKPNYLFELRRPKETISATIPAPEAFTVAAKEYAPGQIEITWAPTLKDARVSLVAVAKDACAVLEKGTIEHKITDDGRSLWSAESFRSPDRDCTFDIEVERRVRTAAPSLWKKGSTQLPANRVDVELVRTETVSVTLAKR